ncbi:hypothetical protein EYF80_003518 [Liparis tanakae]|uniref:Uncharacterized protein n=1 Tax=Liparis tanakae TaxID=230148 RepID=A0A4Z2J871_9TELE|nr:hypothetical protein EYF80_003518 [Liparis tanakae]
MLLSNELRQLPVPCPFAVVLSQPVSLRLSLTPSQEPDNHNQQLRCEVRHLRSSMKCLDIYCMDFGAAVHISHAMNHFSDP